MAADFEPRRRIDGRTSIGDDSLVLGGQPIVHHAAACGKDQQQCGDQREQQRRSSSHLGVHRRRRGVGDEDACPGTGGRTNGRHGDRNRSGRTNGRHRDGNRSGLVPLDGQRDGESETLAAIRYD